jgi:phage shock protein PspC (stress-responsive transcriptional regulator)
MADEHSRTTGPLASRYGLVRPLQGRYVAGVCAALGRATHTDPVLWRVVLAVLVCFGGIGALAYIGLWLLTPEEGDSASPVESVLGRGEATTSPVLTAVLGVVAVVLLLFILPRPLYLVLLGAAAVLVVLLLSNRHGSAGRAAAAPTTGAGAVPPEPAAGAGANPPPAAGAAANPPPAAGAAAGPVATIGTSPAAQRTTATLPLPPDPTTEAVPPGQAAPAGPPPGQAPPPGPPPGQAPPPGAPPPGQAPPPGAPGRYPPPPASGPAAARQPFAPHGPFGGPPPPPAPPPPRPRPRPPRERSALPAVTVSAALLLLGLLGALQLAGAVSVPAAGYVAVALAVTGTGLLIGAWLGRARSLITLGALLVLALPATQILTDWDRPQQPIATSVTWTPTDLAGLDEQYAVSYGDGLLDLRQVEFDGERVVLTVAVRAGEIRVLVPPDVTVVAHSDIVFGATKVFGVSTGGLNSTQSTTEPAPTEPPAGELVLRLDVRFGNIEVRR